MNADIPALLRDHGIKIETSGKHTSPGWVNMRCPFCGDSSSHLGWNINGRYFHCWKCRGHHEDETVAALLGITEHEAFLLMLRYQNHPSHEAGAAVQKVSHAKVCIMPGGQLQAIHIDYLIGRGYDPDKLQRLWHIVGTGPVGAYKFRVIYPIFHDDELVSFQGRDVTDRSDLRWKTCSKADEVRDHKHCLGGVQHATGDTIAIVEGATDGWRLGPGAVWTFGTAYLQPQVNLIAKWKRRFIILDSQDQDPNAAVTADRLANMLNGYPGETHVVELDEGDPGDMAQDDADALMRELKIKSK